MKNRPFPLPGTNNDKVLAYIRENPRVSTTGIKTKLGMNAAVVRKCIQDLLRYEKIVDFPNEQGHHQFEVKTEAL